MVHKFNKNLRYFLWTLFGIIFIIVSVYATSIITNFQGSFSNSTINDTGMFINGNKAFSRTADVVVCKGTSPTDDLIKAFECDVVCKSTDSDCGDDINLIRTNGTIFIKNGFYNINTAIIPLSNEYFLFENGVTFNKTGSNQIFRHTTEATGVQNFTIDGGKFLCQGIGCWYSRGNFTDLTIKNARFIEPNISSNANGIQIFFDAYAPYYYLKFQNNIVEGKSNGYDMVGSGLIYFGEFSHNIFRNGDGQAIGINRVYDTIFNDNYFENVGNIIGMEGLSNDRNIISNNRALYSGNLKLSLAGGYDNSSLNIVDGNILSFGGGIEIFNSREETITNNLVYGSKEKCIFNSCDRCSIKNNKCINTNTNNNVENWNGTLITAGGIILIDSHIYTSPTNNQIIGNLLSITGTSFSSPNGTVYSASYTGGIAIGNNVFNTEIRANTLDAVYDNYKIATDSYTDTPIPRTADVVICKGTSVADDFVKSLECDVVCRSTDSDCGDDINNSISDNKSIVFMNGFYNIGTTINLKSGIKLEGSGATINITSTNGFLRSAYNSNLSDISIQNFNFQSKLRTNQDFLINITGIYSINNLNIENININNYNSSAIQILLRGVACGNGVIKNVYIKNINLINVTDGIYANEKDCESPDKVINFNVNNVYMEQDYSNFISQVGWVVRLTGVNTANINNIHSKRYSDGASVSIYSGKNINIENIYNIHQQDYPIYIGSVQNAFVNNIYSVNPLYWGVLNIGCLNPNTIQQNLYFNNIYCQNCSGAYAGVDKPNIWIDAEYNNCTMKNIHISNFYLNGSKSLGNIQFNNQKNGSIISDVYISDGTIENSDNAGILFANNGDNNNINNIFMDRINIIDAGGNPADVDKDGAIIFSYSNTTNIYVRDSYFSNLTTETTYGIRVLTSSASATSLTLLNNRVKGITTYLSNFGATYTVYSPDYQYSAGVTTNTCSNSSVFAEKTIHNSTTSCTCTGGVWKCWVMT
jgi:hypothetical protein